MNAAFDTGFETSAELVDAALVLGIAAACQNDEFGA
jgi:hypothetical protein